MTQAVYTFVESNAGQIADVVEFDLFDNPGVRAWQYAVMLNNPNRTVSLRSPINYILSKPITVDAEYQQLKLAIKKLSNTDFAWSESVPETFELVDQEFMNRLHRHFTNSCYKLWDHRYSRLGNADIDCILHDINHFIHRLEIYLPTKHKVAYSNTGKEITVKNNDQELGYDIFPFRHYHSYEPADLILDAYILGKTLIESFGCNDDPSSWDINGHMKTNGGSVILLDNTRSKIYNSKYFEQWLVNHAKQKHSSRADFPLGNFVKGHRSKCESLQNNLQEFSVKLHIEL
jgi:hypothetical protein